MTTPENLPALEPVETRFVFIDALRGVACLLVLLRHSINRWPVMEPLLRANLPVWVQRFFDFGNSGVQIFFVLSGFVIAYSLRAFEPTFRYMVNYALRRQVRLDPAYWVTVLAALFVWIGLRAFDFPQVDPVPGAAVVVANLIYIHKILYLTEILSVAWTLCIEIQFYIAFLLLLCAAYRWFPGAKKIKAAALAGGILGFVFLGLGVVLTFGKTRAGSPVFTPFWHHFMGGCICYWVISRQLPRAYLFVYLLAEIGWYVFRPDGQLLVGIVTVGLIFAAGHWQGLTRWTGGAILQYLGSRSYSLYLCHWVVLYVVYRANYHLFGANPAAALASMVVGGTASILAAEGLYRFVERPSVRWSKLLKPKRDTQPARVGGLGTVPVAD